MTQVNTGDCEVDDKVKEWLQWDKNQQTTDEIQDLVNKNDVEELRKRLCSRMEFGTAGLRARMGAGYSMMNDLSIIQTTQGFLRYMEKVCPKLKENGVVIGYDARHNSHRFAWLVATVLLNHQVPVYLFSKICPTPFVPYTVVRQGCDWGIMITASHNPKEDNGYKVYYSNGAQIIEPHDEGISTKIQENLEPWEGSWNTDVVDNSCLRKDPYEDTWTHYMQDLRTLSCSRNSNINSPLKFTYTAMHGVGYESIVEAFKMFNFGPCIPVKEQVAPDPEFPTVRFPNPEEGKSALDLAIQTANEQGSTVILANDPDADRLAIAEKQPDGTWHVFSGNQIGGLLGWWILESYRKNNPNANGSDVYVLNSTVSSKILQTITRMEGFSHEETLTGFKWMGNKSVDLLKEGKKVLFAFEEAIGFMCGTKVLDKDGISAAMVAAEMATYLANSGLTIKQQLDRIYHKYGYHLTSNSYFICHDQQTIKALFENLRNYHSPGEYPKTCGPYPVRYVRDLTTGYDNSRPNNKSVLPSGASSQMITFTFENGCVFTLRTSGTEPKIKYYTEFCAEPGKGLTEADVSDKLNQMVECIIENFVQPVKNNLILRPT